MMMMIVMLSMIFCIPFTPMKATLTLTIWSILSALCILNCNNTWIFLISVMVINFSSAMMMIFCFCSMLSNFESVYKKNSYMALMILTVIFLSMSFNYSPIMKISSSMNLIFFNEWWFLLMCFIILFCMVTINYSMIMPKKKMIETY